MYSKLASRPAKILAPFLFAALAPLAMNIAYADAKSSTQKPSMHMYRYTNAQGVLVTGNSISPEYARKGYQVVTLSGQVLETVPAEPTAAERAKIAQDNQDKISAAEQREQDKQLLLRYSTLDEIQLAKKRKLSEIENKIVLLNSNDATIKSQIDVEQQRAATYERNGQAVPPILLKKIDDLQNESKITSDQITSRKQELTDETTRFDKDIARLTVLDKNRPKQR